VKTYRICDRKEPRFRVSKFRYSNLNRELFDRFKEANPSIKIDYLFFKDIIFSINEEIINHVIENKEGVFLPSGMGRIYLGLFPPKERYKKAETIRNQGIHATHFNFDSDGLVGKIIWVSNDSKYKTKNLRFYGFVGHRNFKTKASQGFKNTPEKYLKDMMWTRNIEYTKRKINERNEINSQSGNQPNQDTEQSS